MTEATAAKPPPEPSPTDVLLMRAIEELRQTRRAVQMDIGQRGETFELSEMTMRLAEFEDALRSVAKARTLEEAREPAPAPEAPPERHRHRAPRRPDHLRPVRVLVPAGLGTVFPLRHIAAAVQHGAAAAAVSSAPWTAAAGTVLAASLTLAPAPASPAHASTHHAAASAARVPGGTRAAPVVPSASPPPAAAPDAARVRKAGRHRAPPSPAAPLPPAPSSSPPASLPPPPVPAPAPPPPPVARGGLLLSTQALNAGPLRTAQVTLTAQGGPVAWSASTDSPAVTLDASGGYLLPGQSAVIEVTIADAPAMGGSAVIDVGPGDEQVTVTWTGLAG